MQVRIWLVLICFLVSPPVFAKQTDASQQAWEAIDDKNFSRAISILEDASTKYPLNLEIQFLLARAYAWNQETDKGINLLNDLLLINPLNVDFLLSKANFLSWKERNEEALSLLAKAREINPNYQEVWKLELKLLAREDDKQNQLQFDQLAKAYLFKFQDQQYIDSLAATRHPEPSYQHSIAARLGIDKLSQGNSNWQTLGFSYSYDTPLWQIIFDTEQHKRFDIYDRQLAIQYLRHNVKDYQLGVTASLSTEQKLLPTWSVGFQAGRQYRQNHYFETFYGHKEYSSTRTDNFKASYSYAWRHWQPKAHLLVTLFEDSEPVFGHLLQLAYYFSDYSFARISWSENTELDDLPNRNIRYYVKVWSIDGRIVLNKQWAFNAAITHHIQGNAYEKNGILAGIQYRF